MGLASPNFSVEPSLTVVVAATAASPAKSYFPLYLFVRASRRCESIDPVASSFTILRSLLMDRSMPG